MQCFVLSPWYQYDIIGMWCEWVQRGLIWWAVLLVKKVNAVSGDSTQIFSDFHVWWLYAYLVSWMYSFPDQLACLVRGYRGLTDGEVGEKVMYLCPGSRHASATDGCERITNRWNECASRFKTKHWCKQRMVCVVSMYLAVSCVGLSCPNSLLDVCRGVVMRCTGLLCFVRFSSTPCSRPAWGVHRTVVSDLFDAGCASLDSRVRSLRCWMCFSWCCGDEHSYCARKIPVVVVTMRRNNVVLWCYS